VLLSNISYIVKDISHLSLYKVKYKSINNIWKKKSYYVIFVLVTEPVVLITYQSSVNGLLVSTISFLYLFISVSSTTLYLIYYEILIIGSIFIL
jgi:hypothetical protein